MKHNHIKFFRRRQFVLGPEYINYEGWIRLKVCNGFLLTVHPDLPITIVKDTEVTAVLMGYAIDPFHTDFTDDAIVRRFINSKISLNHVISSLENLTGRFVLILKCPTGFWMFNDACALRQIYYFTDKHGYIWCASQPETIAENFTLQYDEEALHLRNTQENRLTTESFALINDRTPYREIKYLLANHYLDLKTGISFRFWPGPNSIGSLSVNHSITLIKPILQNSIKAAANRFNLKMGISAGCDSRKSLAASKDVKDKICFFTHTPHTNYQSDLEIPSRLLPQLGIEHHKVHIEVMSKDFEKLYNNSASWARDRHGHIAYTALNYFGTDATVLNSNISEYSQISFWLPRSHVNGEGIALLKGLNHPLAISDYQEWLNESHSACINSHMNVLVLFDLELRSRWVANTLSELDIAYESFNPYNNRKLFCVELSVNERIRRGVHRLDFPKKLIMNMWPEVLLEPINPEIETTAKLKKFIVEKIVHKIISPWLPILEYLKYLKLKREFFKQCDDSMRTQ